MKDDKDDDVYYLPALCHTFMVYSELIVWVVSAWDLLNFATFLSKCTHYGNLFRTKQRASPFGFYWSWFHCTPVTCGVYKIPKLRQFCIYLKFWFASFNALVISSTARKISTLTLTWKRSYFHVGTGFRWPLLLKSCFNEASASWIRCWRRRCILKTPKSNKLFSNV